VIDDQGNNLGVMSIQDAIHAARRADLDLVEVSPNARPPVCRILDFGKFRYENAKREKDSRKHNVSGKVKELKFHVNIEEHDYMVKLRKAESFMLRGMKVKIAMVFRGREMQHAKLGYELVRRIQGDLIHVGLAEMEPKQIGRSINMMLAPLPQKKRLAKFTKEDDEFDDEDDSETETPTTA
jgi:translation initiation factor IF-3